MRPPVMRASVERRVRVDGARTPARRVGPLLCRVRPGYCANVNETSAVWPVATVTFWVCVPSDSCHASTT